jgi:predicted enzyme involved in methoxymalonyl-ACP biosynthesis
VFELIDKVYQFNTTGKCWTRAECADYFKAGNAFFSFRAKDRFSDCGLVGCAIVAGNKIEQFVMNARYMGLDIEMAVIFALEGRMRTQGATEIKGQLIETKDNEFCRDLYIKCGFKQEGNLWTKLL